MACWLDAVTPAPSLEQLRMVLHTVTRGVEFLHMKDVIHCDLKLENIFMSSSAPNASPVIGDFDVSKDLDARRTETTATSSGGTAMYLSPERLDHQPATAATDVYALGVVFVLALTEKGGRAGLLQSLQKLTGVSVRESLLMHGITGPLVTITEVQATPDPFDSRQLLKAMLDPSARPTATQILEHPLLACKTMLLQLDEQKRSKAEEQAELERRNPKQECILCCGDFRLDDGIECNPTAPIRHFLCSACLSKHVDDSMGEMEGMETAAACGCVFCPMQSNGCGASAPFTDKDIAKVVVDSVFARYSDWKHTALEKRLPQDWSIRKKKDVEVALVEAPDKVAFFQRRIQQSAKVTPATTAAQRMDGLRVHRVVRVENKQLFEDYQREREKLRKKLESTQVGVERLEEHAPAWLKAKAGLAEIVIDPDCNEFRLWHGTSATVSEILAQHGFDERVGGDTNGGLYGQGSYFADASSKANQYSTAPFCKAPTNIDGQHCMLSCRVLMGDPNMAKKYIGR